MSDRTKFQVISKDEYMLQKKINKNKSSNRKQSISDNNDKEKWLNLMSEYGSAKNIAKHTGINYQTVFWNLKKHDICPSKKAEGRRRAAQLDIEEVKHAYKELKSSTRVAEKFQVSQSAILSMLPEDLIAQNRPVKYLCNEDFFDYDNELSFYWAGFLAADGGLLLRDEKYKQIAMGLAVKDVATLEDFKKDIKFEGPIAVNISKATKPEWNDSEKRQICISNDKIYDVLQERFGLHLRKTFTTKFPEWLVDHELVHHFMRGYFDGDGSVFWNQKKDWAPQLYFSVRGTPEFLMVYRRILEQNTSVIPRGDRPIRISNNCGELSYGGNLVLMSIRDFLYKDATRFMQRKYDLCFHENVRRNERKYRPPPAAFAEAREKRKRPVVAIGIKDGSRLWADSVSAM